MTIEVHRIPDPEEYHFSLTEPDAEGYQRLDIGMRFTLPVDIVEELDMVILPAMNLRYVKRLTGKWDYCELWQEREPELDPMEYA